MSATLTYPDAYLAKFCTEDRENRAFDDVDREGTFDTDTRNRLTILRCYIIACLENQASPDDLFTAKLKSYGAEYKGELVKAKADLAIEEGTNALIFTIPLERA